MLLAGAGVAYVFGRFIAPRYEAMLSAASDFEEVTPISTFSLWTAGVLIVALFARLFYRWKKRSS